MQLRQLAKKYTRFACKNYWKRLANSQCEIVSLQNVHLPHWTRSNLLNLCTLLPSLSLTGNKHISEHHMSLIKSPLPTPQRVNRYARVCYRKNRKSTYPPLGRLRVLQSIGQWGEGRLIFERVAVSNLTLEHVQAMRHHYHHRRQPAQLARKSSTCK